MSISLGHPRSVQLRFDGVMHRNNTNVDQNGAQYSKYQNIVYTQYNEYLFYLIKNHSKFKWISVKIKRVIMHICKNVDKTLNVNIVCDR